MGLLFVTDSPEEAVAHVEENYRKYLERMREKRIQSERLRPEAVPGREVAPE
jgi:hypothetical protein